jgi:hypothetical protein
LLQKGGKSTKGYASQIINVSSISGVMKGSSGGQYAYAASKEAIVQVGHAGSDVIALLICSAAQQGHGEGVPPAQDQGQPDRREWSTEYLLAEGEGRR